MNEPNVFHLEGMAIERVIFFSFVELKLILGFGSARRHLAYRENY